MIFWSFDRSEDTFVVVIIFAQKYLEKGTIPAKGSMSAALLTAPLKMSELYLVEFFNSQTFSL